MSNTRKRAKDLSNHKTKELQNQIQPQNRLHRLTVNKSEPLAIADRSAEEKEKHLNRLSKGKSSGSVRRVVQKSKDLNLSNTSKSYWDSQTLTVLVENLQKGGHRSKKEHLVGPEKLKKEQLVGMMLNMAKKNAGRS